MKTKTLPLLATVLLAAACGSSAPKNNETRPPAPPAAAPAPAPGGSMAGMRGMGGMQADSMMAQMRTHMQAMHGAGGDSLKAMLPTHRQMAASLLAEMSREMRQMNMPADPAWTATADSVQQDLVRMPDMEPGELQAAMPAHEARLDRLMRMHQSMMSGGGSR